MQTSVTPEGRFRVGVHTPSYTVSNLRKHDHFSSLGLMSNGTEVTNNANFPQDNVAIEHSGPIYEILNPLPFRGCTYIDSNWADVRAEEPDLIRIEQAPAVSLRSLLGNHCEAEAVRSIVENLPGPLRYELAARSTDPEELVWLAQSSCQMVLEDENTPTGLLYAYQDGRLRPAIHDHTLFETVANNPCLPDAYKKIMVLKPGAQGRSEIVGEFTDDSDGNSTEIFEYLRSNSYIPGGHFAANFSPNSIRYSIEALSPQDIKGLRHLYYQRIYVTLARQLGLACPDKRQPLTCEELEQVRTNLQEHFATQKDADALATLWGWNFGYDISGSGYRLHASHQVIHHQYALVPLWVKNTSGGQNLAFSSGDMITGVVAQYRRRFNSDFFSDYLRAIRSNTRTDQSHKESSLIVWEDENILLFVPKAQVSQWELQIMVIADSPYGPVGNIVEAGSAVRQSLDEALLRAQRILAGMGARMVTTIEYSKRFGLHNGQRLLYSLMPKLPWSMGGFTEMHKRFICSHYPEDFARACRRQLRKKNELSEL